MRAGDTVRLTRQHRDLRPGTEGVVIGFYRSDDDPGVAVAFNNETLRVSTDALEIAWASERTAAGFLDQRRARTGRAPGETDAASAAA